MIKKILLAGLTVIWIIGFILCRNILYTGPNYWIGFLFGLVGFIAAGIGVYFLGKSNRDTVETGMIPVYYTSIFVILMILLNLYFAFAQMRSLIPVFVVVNLLFVLIYGVVFYGAVKHLMRVNELTQRAPAKMKNTAVISQQLAVLLSITKDAGLRQELSMLKENVAYSSNVSQSFSENDEMVFLEKLHKIQEDLLNNVDTEVIRTKIKDAANTWKIRNSKINIPH